MSTFFIHRPWRKKPQKCILLMHGLNASRLCMRDLVNDLVDQECLVIEGRVSDHGPYKRKVKVTPSLWLSEVEKLIEYAASMAEKDQLPLTYCGFSLGGFLFTHLSHDIQKKVDRAVLMSPPLATTQATRFVIEVVSLLPITKVPTLIRPKLRHSSVINPYHYKTLYRLGNIPIRKPAVETTVFLGGQDLIVSFIGSKAIAQNRGLQVHEVNVLDPVGHLSIYKPLIPPNQWDVILRAITNQSS